MHRRDKYHVAQITDSPLLHNLYYLGMMNRQLPHKTQHFMFRTFFARTTGLIMLISACTAQSQTTISAAQTEDMLQKDPSVQLVDLRTQAEINQTGKIAGAKHINFNSPDFQAQIGQLDKNKPVIVYCASGGRSPRAAAVMTKMGFKTVYDYAGGMNDWKAKGKKTVQ
jgi:rhodanese-related sulfurtransferase